MVFWYHFLQSGNLGTARWAAQIIKILMNNGQIWKGKDTRVGFKTQPASDFPSL